MNQDIRQLIEQLNAIAVGKTVPVNVFTATLRKSADALERLTQPVGVEPVCKVNGYDINVIDWLDTSESVKCGDSLYSAETVARLQAEKAQLQDERDMNRHLLDKVSANFDKLFEQNAQLQAERDELARLLDGARCYTRHSDYDWNISFALEVDAALAKIEGKG